ncbi:MAG: serine hydrolase, partial [Planctomycetota bacterium]|nr:serine hydrolase [Planctomycetota bacterium]
MASASEDVWPDAVWPNAEPADVGMDAQSLKEARDYALTGGGSGMILRQGRVVMAWGDQKQRYDLKSTTKSIGVTALGLAIADGKATLDDPAVKHHATFAVPPESNRETGWIDRITLRHLASQTAGFDKPGGDVPLLFEPGTRWKYSDAGPNWLAECLTLAYRRDMHDLLFERVFMPVGVTADDLVWRKNQYRPHEIDGITRREFGSGISANVEALSRLGYLYLRDGRWRERQLVPKGFIEIARVADPEVARLPVQDPDEYGAASKHYGLLWWNNADGSVPGVPRDTYWSWGLYDSLIVVMPSLDIVAVRAGKSWKREGGGHYAVLEPFLRPIAGSVQQDRDPKRTSAVPPYPHSHVIASIEWAPPETIRRDAAGSDNWPVTWADDDRLYTAYGDGWGFGPRKGRKKLSLGLAVVAGGPENWRGENLPAPSFERTGDGLAGEKASGMLMLDGVLYVWVRNAGNSRLGWSEDPLRETWTWSNWKWTESFGCPMFLNFGRHNAGARDDFVYVYSLDGDSAYRPADGMILARVQNDRLRDKVAYEFYAGMSEDGSPRWTDRFEDRQAVFRDPGRCSRSSVSYNAGLKRYLWVQILPGGDTRYR